MCTTHQLGAGNVVSSSGTAEVGNLSLEDGVEDRAGMMVGTFVLTKLVQALFSC